jgi:hypothetical protein
VIKPHVLFHQNRNVKAIRKVTPKSISNASKKIISAYFSYLALRLSFTVRIDKNDRKLAAVNKIDATPVNSSIIVCSLYFDILREVKTIRQKPSKFDDVFNI